MQHSCSHSNAICNHSFKNRIELRTQEQPLVAKHIGGTNSRQKRPQPHPPHRRRYLSSPAAATLHGKTQGFVLRLPPQNIAHATFMQPFQCDLQPQLQEPHRTTHTGTTTRCKTHRTEPIRDRNDPSRTRRTDEVPFIAGCSHFTRKNTRFRAPPSSPKHSPCNIHAATHHHLRSATTSLQEPHRTTSNRNNLHRCKTHLQEQFATETTSQPHHFRFQTRYLSSPAAATLHRKNTRFRASRLPPQVTTSLPPPLPIVTTSHRHHLPFVITSLRHHFPSSPLPIVPTSLPHHSPSSSLPFVTTSHRHHFPSSPPPFVHFPSSPLPFLTTSHRPHLPSSPFPFIITSLRHHFPSSPLPFVTTSLRHHFPSSPLPFVTTSHRHHFPSSPLPFVTTRHYHHPSLSPPFKVNSTASYSFVMYCYVMYCYVIYHPASFQVAEFYLSVTRKYCFPTSFD